MIKATVRKKGNIAIRGGDIFEVTKKLLAETLNAGKRRKGTHAGGMIQAVVSGLGPRTDGFREEIFLQLPEVDDALNQENSSWNMLELILRQ